MEELVDGLIDSQLLLWVPDASAEAAKEAGINLENRSHKDILKVLKKHEPAPFKERIAAEVKKELMNFGPSLEYNDQLLDELVGQLVVDSETAKQVRAKLKQGMPLVFEKVAERLARIVVNNRVISKAVSRDDLDR